MLINFYEKTKGLGEQPAGEDEGDWRRNPKSELYKITLQTVYAPLLLV